MTYIGANLTAVVYWSTEEPFIDRFHTAGKWVAKDASGADISSKLVLDSHGDVSNLTGVSSLGIAVEVDPITAPVSHRYELTFTGTAKVSIAGAKIVSQTAGKVVFDYTGNQSYASITFTGLDPNKPVANAHLVRSDQVSLFNSGELFNPDFVAKVAKLGVVRFMDWGDTNDSKDVSWATRTTLDDRSWSMQTTQDGVPIEAMVKLANEAHVDMWYNVPTKADDNYVTQALTYIRDHLDPTLKVHVEWSNEVWNTGFSVASYAQNKANALWGNGSTVKGGNEVYYGYRSAQIASIAHKVFGAQADSRVSDVLAGQAANSGLMTYILQGVAKAGLGSASSLFKEYAIAPYFGRTFDGGTAQDLQTVLNWAKSGSAGLDAAFKELQYGGTLSNDSSLVKVHAYLVSSAAVAKSAGLSLVAYEGGPHLTAVKFAAADKATIRDFYDRLLADPRMEKLYSAYLADFKATGGTGFVAFNDVGTTTDFGAWGMLNSIYDTSSQRYNALMAANPKTIATITTATGTTTTSAITITPVSATASTTTTTTTTTTTPKEATPTTSASTDQTIDPAFVPTPTAPTDPTDETGTDTVSSSVNDGHLVGTSGNDNLTAGIVPALIEGGAGSDTLHGSADNDHIYGNVMTGAAGQVDGADYIDAGDGNDYVNGNAGDDTILGGNGNDRLYGGAGNDSILGGNGNDYIQGNKGDDLLFGDAGDDTIHGGADNDSLVGGAGNDQLFGDAGNDTLVGGPGFDVLTGGQGNDTFVFNFGDANFTTTGADAYKTDEITDLAHGIDKIKIDFTPVQLLQGSVASVQAAVTAATNLLHGHVGEKDVAAITVGSDTYLFWDADGTGGAPDSAVKVDHVNAVSFSVADFL